MRNTRAGPLHDRLQTIADRLDAGLQQGWQIAKRGHEIDAAVKALDPTRLRSQLGTLQGQADNAPLGQPHCRHRVGAIATGHRRPPQGAVGIDRRPAAPQRGPPGRAVRRGPPRSASGAATPTPSPATSTTSCSSSRGCVRRCRSCRADVTAKRIGAVLVAVALIVIALVVRRTVLDDDDAEAGPEHVDDDGPAHGRHRAGVRHRAGRRLPGRQGRPPRAHRAGRAGRDDPRRARRRRRTRHRCGRRSSRSRRWWTCCAPHDPVRLHHRAAGVVAADPGPPDGREVRGAWERRAPTPPCGRASATSPATAWSELRRRRRRSGASGRRSAASIARRSRWRRSPTPSPATRAARRSTPARWATTWSSGRGCGASPAPTRPASPAAPRWRRW